MAKYYAHISGSPNIVTNFNPRTSYTGNGNYLRLEYVGNIITDATRNCYVWRQPSGNWFSLEQGTYGQYMNLANTTYVTDVANVEANRRKFNSDSLSDPAIFVLDNGTANLTFENWTTTGTFSGDLPSSNIVFFPTGTANSMIMDFYGLKVYGSGDTLLYDFVPGWNGMHTLRGIIDKVSGNFFSATNQSYITLYDLSTFEVDVAEINATYTGSTTPVTLTADDGVSWTATTIPSWVTLSSTAGTGTTQLTVTIEPNTAYSARTGSIVFTSSESDTAEIAITQAKYPLLVPDENIFRGGDEVVKAYRSGSTINKVYRNGAMISWRRNPPTNP